MNGYYPNIKITIEFNCSEKAIIEFLFDALCLSWAGNERISCLKVIHNWEQEDRPVEK